MVAGVEKAVLLVGFGMPDNPVEVQPFLQEIYADPYNWPRQGWGRLQPFVAAWRAMRNSNDARRRYLSIAGKRTAREVVSGMASCLQRHLQEEGKTWFRVFPAMRYGEPSICQALLGVTAAGIHEVVIIPLSPHYAMATVGSIEAVVQQICTEGDFYGMGVEVVKSWYDGADLIGAWVDSIRFALNSFPEEVRSEVHLVFVAPAVPRFHVLELNDPYPTELHESAKLIRDVLGGDAKLSLAYQNKTRFGNLTRPTIEVTLADLGKAGVKNCLIVPYGKLYDDVDTWCDLDIDLLPMSGTFGIERLKRAHPPSDSSHIIKAMTYLVR